MDKSCSVVRTKRMPAKTQGKWQKAFTKAILYVLS